MGVPTGPVVRATRGLGGLNWASRGPDPEATMLLLLAFAAFPRLIVDASVTKPRNFGGHLPLPACGEREL